MTETLLTAVIPIHKMSGKLGSLRKWTQEAVKQDIDLILIHDFGDQETELELVELITTVSSDHIKFISGRFGGPGAARNEGLPYIRTQYFCFWDSDDEPQVRAFVEMAKEAQKAKADIAVGKFTRTSDRKFGGGVRNRSSMNFLDQVAFNPGIWRMVFQTNLIGNYRFENLKWAEDQVFLSNINFADREVLEYQDLVYLYNNENNSRLTNDPKNAADLLPSIEKIMETFNSNNSKPLCSFNAILVLRQTLTLLKRGDLSLKRRGLMHLFTLLKILGLGESVELFKKLISSRKIK